MHSPRELTASTVHSLARQLIHHQIALRLLHDDLYALDYQRLALLSRMTTTRRLIDGVQNKVDWEMEHNGALLNGGGDPLRADRQPWEDDDDGDDDEDTGPTL